MKEKRVCELRFVPFRRKKVNFIIIIKKKVNFIIIHHQFVHIKMSIDLWLSLLSISSDKVCRHRIDSSSSVSKAKMYIIGSRIKKKYIIKKHRNTWSKLDRIKDLSGKERGDKMEKKAPLKLSTTTQDRSYDNKTKTN